MTITRRIKQFINEVVTAATNESESDVTMEECINEYTDQILSNDYECVVIMQNQRELKFRAL